MDGNAAAPTIIVHAGRLTPHGGRRTPRSWRSLLQDDRMRERGACIGIGLIALGLFLYHTRDVSLWYDEIYSVELSRLPWPVFWKVHQANMLLYYILLRAWLDVTGLFGVVPSPLIVRLPSIAMMALAAVVILLLGSRFWNLTTGVLAGLLFVLNGLVLQQAQQARGYAVQVLLVCLAWAVLLLALLAQTPGNYYQDAEVQPFLETTSWMEHRYTTGDGIICRPDTKACGIPMSYYLEHLYRRPQKMPAQFSGIYVWERFHSTSTQDAALASYLQDHQRIFVFTVAPIGHDPQTVKDTVPQLLLASGYRLVATYRPAPTGHLGDVEVDEYSR